MKALATIAQLLEQEISRPADLFRKLADSVLEAELANGSRVLDASDFRIWLQELASAADVELM